MLQEAWFISVSTKEVRMTDIFEKAAKAAKDVGDTVVSSAKSLGGSLYNSMYKDQYWIKS